MKFERPLKEQELKVLNRMIKQTKPRTSRGYRIRFYVVLTSLPLIVGSIAYFFVSPDSRPVLYLTVAAYMGIFYWIMIEGHVEEKKKRNSLLYLKNKNLVTVVEVNSDYFYVLDEKDDEGVHYLYQLSDNKVLSFGGQNFYETKKFPSDRFEIVEGRGINNERLLFEIFVHGEEIQPRKVISGREKWELHASRYYHDPDTITIMDGTIEDYLDLIRKDITSK